MHKKNEGFDLLRLAPLVNPLECRGHYIATSNNMKLVHWPLMGGLLHLVQRGGALMSLMALEIVLVLLYFE